MVVPLESQHHGESGGILWYYWGKFFLMSEVKAAKQAKHLCHKSRVSRQQRWCSADHTDPFSSVTVNHCVLVFQYVLVALRLQLSEDHIASILVSGSVTISTHFTGIK